MKIEYLTLQKNYFRNTVEDIKEIYQFIQNNINYFENLNIEQILSLSKKLSEKVNQNKDLNINEYLTFTQQVFDIVKKDKKKYRKQDIKFFMKFLIVSPINLYIYHTYYDRLIYKINLIYFKNKWLSDFINHITDKKLKKYLISIYEGKVLKKYI